jgi:uncharacterized protein DUF6894
MPMYYFNLRNSATICDVYGTDLADTNAARSHADVVAKELKFNNDALLDQEWSRWTMSVQDGDGLELFSFSMADRRNGNGH